MHLLTEKLANWLRSDSQANHLFATSSGISSSQVNFIRQSLDDGSRRGVTRSRATRSRKIKLNDITRRVKNLSREIYELSKFLFVACNAPLLRLDCQNEGGAFEGKEEEEEEQEGKQGKQP